MKRLHGEALLIRMDDDCFREQTMVFYFAAVAKEDLRFRITSFIMFRLCFLNHGTKLSIYALNF